MEKRKQTKLADNIKGFDNSVEFKRISESEDQSNSWCFQLGFIRGIASFILIWLFQKFDDKEFIPKNNTLKKDIQKAIDTILKIEDLEKGRKKRYSLLEVQKEQVKGNDYSRMLRKSTLTDQKYRSYFVSYINDLDSILRKTPINIGVTFESFLAPPPFGITKFSKLKHPVGESFKGRISKIKKLNKKKSLPDLRHYPFGLDVSGVNLTDEKARMYLTCGLFYYSQNLIHGNFKRPRKCPYCNHWFLASRRNHVFCSIPHKDAYDASTPEGKKKSRLASKKYRQKQKKRNLKSSGGGNIALFN